MGAYCISSNRYKDACCISDNRYKVGTHTSDKHICKGVNNILDNKCKDTGRTEGTGRLHLGRWPVPDAGGLQPRRPQSDHPVVAGTV